jgi:hypothetical protein
MAQVLRVKRTGVFHERSARARWYKRLLDFDGRPLEAFVASVEADPPSTPEAGLLKGQLEPVGGWLRFFQNEDLLEIDGADGSVSTRGRNNWSENEVRQVVSDYFEMWRKEQTRQPYSKTEHRSRLIENGLDRSKGSIEFKHQNISAVLLEEGLPYLVGYRPASNYQRLLGDIVREHISTKADDLEHVLEASDLGFDDAARDVNFSQWLVPTPKPTEHQPAERRTRRASKIDYAAREDRNRKLGRSGEQIVLEYERWRLEKAGRKDLSARIRWVAEQDGDGLGYDITSFDEDGTEIFIEVKTTRSGTEMPFLISANEVAVSQELGAQYRLYRVFNASNDPRVYVQPGRMTDYFDLTPRLFEARRKAME